MVKGDMRRLRGTDSRHHRHLASQGTSVPHGLAMRSWWSRMIIVMGRPNRAPQSRPRSALERYRLHADALSACWGGERRPKALRTAQALTEQTPMASCGGAFVALRRRFQIRLSR